LQPAFPSHTLPREKKHTNFGLKCKGLPPRPVDSRFSQARFHWASAFLLGGFTILLSVCRFGITFNHLGAFLLPKYSIQFHLASISREGRVQVAPSLLTGRSWRGADSPTIATTKSKHPQQSQLSMNILAGGLGPRLGKPCKHACTASLHVDRPQRHVFVLPHLTTKVQSHSSSQATAWQTREARARRSRQTRVWAPLYSHRFYLSIMLWRVRGMLRQIYPRQEKPQPTCQMQTAPAHASVCRSNAHPSNAAVQPDVAIIPEEIKCSQTPEDTSNGRV
jgi:hypothetical protein